MPQDVVEVTDLHDAAADQLTEESRLIQFLEGTLTARIVRLEGEVFALRHQVAVLSELVEKQRDTIRQGSV